MESGLKVFKGVSITPLKKINNNKGDVFHVLKCTEESFRGFGEVYCTTVHFGSFKGWKKHTRMLMNLVVLVGEVEFYFYNELLKQSFVIKAGQNNYIRLTVEPGLWVAFKGVEHGLNLILNIANIQHDPSESINVEIDRFPLVNNGIY